MKITKHSKQRIMQRTDGINSISEAKRVAKQARICGDTINKYARYPEFFNYLKRKRGQTNSCSIRVYKGCIYIWRGKNILVTAHKIPERYIQEMKEVDSIDL